MSKGQPQGHVIEVYFYQIKLRTCVISHFHGILTVLCEEKHDLVHFLFTCVFAKEAWKRVSNFLKSDIKLSDIAFGHKLSCLENYIISFVTFYIFKFWIPGNKTIALNCFINLKL